jgi:hypothetical protein
LHAGRLLATSTCLRRTTYRREKLLVMLPKHLIGSSNEPTAEALSRRDKQQARLG